MLSPPWIVFEIGLLGYFKNFLRSPFIPEYLEYPKVPQGPSIVLSVNRHVTALANR